MVSVRRPTTPRDLCENPSKTPRSQTLSEKRLRRIIGAINYLTVLRRRRRREVWIDTNFWTGPKLSTTI